MAKPNQVAPELLNAATMLISWAKKRGVSEDAYVVALVVSLTKGENLSHWATYEHMEWLPRPRSHVAQRMGEIGRFIAIVRNVLIFMPVALTWFAIGKATRAFEAFIASGSQSTANFLEFWQNGGGVLSPAWRIGNVATLDFQIIIILILLSLAAGILQARAIRRSNSDNSFFDQERMKLALELDIVLNKYEEITPLTMSRDLARAFEKMVKSTKDLSAAASRIEKSTVAMGKVDVSSKALLESIKNLKSQAFKVDAQLKKVTKPVKKAIAKPSPRAKKSS